MQNHKYLEIPVFLFLSALLFGCATTNVPKNWSSEPNEMATGTYGGWINAECSNEHEKEYNITGELIAVSDDSIFVADSAFHSIAKKDITNARLVCYKSNSGSMSALVALGTISTISNGWFLVFTMPMWLIGGTISGTTQSYIPIIDYPENNFKEFSKFSRFPQGLPEKIDRRKIKMKDIDYVK